MRFPSLCLAVVSLALGGTAFGEETLYVTDKLMLGLYRTKEGSGKQLKSLPSGKALTVLERANSYVRVRTENGLEGWVKLHFLVKEPPAIVRLAELESRLQDVQAVQESGELLKGENGRLREKIKQLEEKLSNVKNVSLATKPQQTEGCPPDTLPESSSFSGERLSESSDGSSRLLQSSRLHYLLMPLGVLAISAGSGFLLGIKWLDRRIRRRHGGFRIW